jgi:hypothetical protein
MPTISSGLRQVLDLHRERKAMPHCKTTDFAGVYGAHVLDELDDLQLEFEVVWEWPARRCVI